MSPYYKIVGIIVLFMCFSYSSAQNSECTNEIVIDPIASTCLATYALAFGSASDDAAKCAVVQESILANCIVTNIQNTYSVTCSNAQQYQMVILYRATITTALSDFDPVAKSDKAPDSIVVFYKRHFIECLVKGNPTYTLTTIMKEDILNSHKFVLSSFGIAVCDENQNTASIYRILKLHKCPYKQRYIDVSANCTTKPLFKLVTLLLVWILKTVRT